MLKNLTKCTLSVAALCLASGLAVQSFQVSAQDAMGMKPEGAMKSDMSGDMSKMKMMMMDPAMKPGMDAAMMKMHAMDAMAADLAKDPECKAMCEKMMMSDAGKMDMMGTPDQMKMTKDDIMKDPEAMKMVMARAMMMNMSKGPMKMDSEGGMKGTAKEVTKPMEGDMKK